MTTETYTREDLILDLEGLEGLAAPDWGLGTDDELWSEILPGLWQGGTAADDELQFGPRARAAITPADFDTVITLYAWANPVGWGVREMRYGFYDADVDSFDVESLFEVVRFAHAEWRAGRRVLIRCQAGWNRSGLVTALVLMRAGRSAAEAIRLIRQRRCVNALCNRAFEEFLRAQSPGVWRGQRYQPAPKRAAKRPAKRARA